jgi:histidine ammonia-lyase
VITIDGIGLDCAAVHAVAHGAPVALDPAARAAMVDNEASIPPGPSVLEEKRHWLVGGFADALSGEALARTFILGHCAGVGPPLPIPLVRATMLARANVLAGAKTGCRPEAASVLIEMLNAGQHPVVPSQGSVGAAGDLAPLAHIAQAACGYRGPLPGVRPYTPTPKEALALINGISMTTALGAMAVHRSRRLLDTAICAVAMTMEASTTDNGCIDERLVGARNHPGAVAVAERLRAQLRDSTAVAPGRPVGAFSIRAAPAVLGTVMESLANTETVLMRELNGAGDNPLLIDGEWIEGGNFHGAPVAHALDALKIAMTQLASISERRSFRLTHGGLSQGLPSFLVKGTGLNSGFMLTQYTAASLTSECKGLAMPASVDTIPTVQHHEDHVSMGPISARMLLELVECVADVLGIEVLLAAQALDLRVRGIAVDAMGKACDAPRAQIAPGIEKLHRTVRTVIPYWEDDAVLHPLLAAASALVRRGAIVGDDAPW